MQGIEPKFHNNLTERIEAYRCLTETLEGDGAQFSEILSGSSELRDLYEEYLTNKKKLEKSIKDYKQFHDGLRKVLTPKFRELRRKLKSCDQKTNH
ncbi:hypothetical protein MKJ01_02870 [Chryseobacterium sp. SSA4.19]|uniref:hypothetical protein n=1 Tax=Chryseobacterium sp. SSA4.19 TaxID=2919915 RepID=UPI001F4DADBF|nr:hypothetical protein [Chryseobacterium sp. SSA4.19]MCJ8152705.1 hypothetical protein [Chryseobacterium sp. SSA4.19]